MDGDIAVLVFLGNYKCGIAMPTISQLVRKPRLARHIKSKVPALGNSPQKKRGSVRESIQQRQKTKFGIT